MSNLTYKSFDSQLIPEDVCNKMQPILTKNGIWNARLSQNGKYRGLKVAFNEENKAFINRTYKECLNMTQTNKPS